MKYIDDLYRARFTQKELDDKLKVWQILTKHFFQRYVKRTDTVLDVGAGYCEFINNIRAKKKIALDINKDTKKFAAPDVEVILDDCRNMGKIKSNSVDVVFISNFLEHMPNADDVEKVLIETKRILKKEGQVLILQPNIKYAYREYWDYFDHVVPLSHKSTAEALLKNDFKLVEVRPRFLPYTSKSKVPKWSFLIIIYLKLKIAQKLLGKQMFVVAQK